jgi:hypothetical protein
VEDDQTGDESSYSFSSPIHPEGMPLSVSEKVENLETQFQPVTDPSVPAVFEMVEVALESFSLIPASEPKLTTLKKFRKLSGVKVSGPERYPEQGLEASPTTSVIHPGPDIRRHPHHHSLPFSVEARSSYLYT